MKIPCDDTNLQPPGSMGAWFDLAITACSLLEPSHNLRQEKSDPPLSRILDTLEEIVRLEGKLHKWMTAYYQRTPNFLHRPVNALQLLYPIGQRGVKFPLRYCYDFSNMACALTHICYWMSLLVLLTAHIDITKAHQCQLCTIGGADTQF